MGIILSKFRKKRSTLEVLESIEETISSIEESRKESELQRKKVGQCFMISVTFIIIVVLLYLYFFSASFRDKKVSLFLIIAAPTIGEILRRVISWYYQRKIVKTREKLIDLRAQKRKVLDEVMNKETFIKAKEILEKFAPDQLPKGVLVPVIKNAPTPLGNAKTPVLSNNVKRNLKFSPEKSIVPSPAPVNQSLVRSFPSQNLPRPILSADRSALDKLVDMIVGDGPSHRYALICNACSNHNGMALEEEFEYLAFRCAYCRHLNPARKLRLTAPKLADESASLIEDVSFNSSHQGFPEKKQSEAITAITEKDELNGDKDLGEYISEPSSDEEGSQKNVEVNQNSLEENDNDTSLTEEKNIAITSN